MMPICYPKKAMCPEKNLGDKEGSLGVTRVEKGEKERKKWPKYFT